MHPRILLTLQILSSAEGIHSRCILDLGYVTPAAPARWSEPAGLSVSQEGKTERSEAGLKYDSYPQGTTRTEWQSTRFVVLRRPERLGLSLSVRCLPRWDWPAWLDIQRSVLPSCRLSTLHGGLHLRAVDTAFSSESTSSASANRAANTQRNDMGGQVWLTALGVSLLTLLGLLLRPWHSVTIPPSVQPAPL